MKVTLESTSKTTILELDGPRMTARIWEGVTESGIKVHAYITRIAVNRDEDLREFDAELEACRDPSPQVAAIPGRLIL